MVPLCHTNGSECSEEKNGKAERAQLIEANKELALGPESRHKSHASILTPASAASSATGTAVLSSPSIMVS